MEPAAPAPVDEAGAKAKKKKDKVRSAWISFVGRIVAQVVGAAATVALTLFVVQRAQNSPADTREAGASTAPATPAGGPATPTDVAPATGPTAVPALTPPAELAIAVLPLDNFSGDPSQDYFADGMTEALIAELAQMRGIRVISRTSSIRYKGERKPLPEIARELGVTHIVEGSVLRAGARVRVTAQLIEAASDRHVWARSYDRTATDVLALHSDVAGAIRAEISGAMTSSEQPRLGRRAAVDPQVYDLYLKARYAEAQRTDEGFRDAIQLFEQAAAKDASFAPAFAGLADTYVLLSRSVHGALPVQDAMAKARAGAERALALDPLSPDAHLAMAAVFHRFDWDWPAAERSYAQARDLGPAYAPAHQWYAVFLAEQGRAEMARIEAERAISLDPLDASVHRTAGLAAYFGRDFVRAASLQRRAVDLDGGTPVSTLMLAWSLVESGEPRAAVELVRTLPPGLPQDQEVRATLGYALARAGDAGAARRIRQELQAAGARPSLSLARLYAALGDDAALLRVAEQGVAERQDLVTGLKADVVFDRVRAHPRFVAILSRLNLG
jgi:TolB-like protein/Tfp pilus assembly protein PilF